MRTGKITFNSGLTALAMAALWLTQGTAQAAEYWLRAAPTTVLLPDPNGGSPISVPMWGYATCTAAFASCTDPVTVPGPALDVPALDTTLTVHLRNDLATPTSLVVNGLFKAMNPVWADGTSGPRPNLAARVRSFDAEASPGGTADYTWNNVKPGTYLYQSGTHAQVQVQMGLYGAVAGNTVAATASTPAEAYAGVSYDNQATLLYSEVDPALHAAVAAGDYGTPAGPTSTLGYAPKYFLINGQPYPAASLLISPAGNPGTTLLRLLNAGLTTHVPMIQGTHWTVVAEDGKPYPWRRSQYTALLTAAKTMDVVLTADIGGASYPIMDRRLSLSNAGQSGGGMLAVLQFAAQGSVGGGSSTGNLPPIANDDGYNAIVGVSFNQGAPGVLANDANTDGLPLPIKAVAATGNTANGGTYALHSNGSFSYTPAVGFAGATDTFTYQVTDGSALANTPGTVTINLSTPTAPALTTLDTFDRANASSLGSSWSQVVSTGPAAPDLQIDGNAAKAVSVSLGGLALWNATTFAATQGASISGAAPLALSAVVLKATGGTDSAPANYVRVRCEGSNLVVATMMGGSNASAFVRQAQFPAAGCVGGGTLSAVVDDKGLTTTFLNGLYIGGVQLPDVPAWKGTGRIGIQLQDAGNLVDNFSGGAP